MSFVAKFRSSASAKGVTSDQARARASFRRKRLAITRASSDSDELMTKLKSFVANATNASNANALKGRPEAMRVRDAHYVLKGNAMKAPFREGLETIVFATGEETRASARASASDAIAR